MSTSNNLGDFLTKLGDVIKDELNLDVTSNQLNPQDFANAVHTQLPTIALPQLNVPTISIKNGELVVTDTNNGEFGGIYDVYVQKL